METLHLISKNKLKQDRWMFFTRNAQIQSPLDSQFESKILGFVHFPEDPSPYFTSSFDLFQIQINPNLTQTQN